MFKMPFAAIVASVSFAGTFVLSACGAAPEAEEEGVPTETAEDSFTVQTGTPTGTRYLYRPKIGIQIQSSNGALQTVGECCTNPETGVSCTAEPCSQCAGAC
jgi:hypothetical protein